MKSLKSFNGWLMSRILIALGANEGYTVESTSYFNNGMRSVVVDSFGFRQEIQVKTLSNISDNLEGIHAYSDSDAAMAIDTPDLKV